MTYLIFIMQIKFSTYHIIFTLFLVSSTFKISKHCDCGLICIFLATVVSRSRKGLHIKYQLDHKYSCNITSQMHHNTNNQILTARHAR